MRPRESKRRGMRIQVHNSLFITYKFVPMRWDFVIWNSGTSFTALYHVLGDFSSGFLDSLTCHISISTKVYKIKRWSRLPLDATSPSDVYFNFKMKMWTTLRKCFRLNPEAAHITHQKCVDQSQIYYSINVIDQAELLNVVKQRRSHAFGDHDKGDVNWWT